MSDGPAPEAVALHVIRPILDEFQERLGLHLKLWSRATGGERVFLYEVGAATDGSKARVSKTIPLRDGPVLELEVGGAHSITEGLASILQSDIERAHDFSQEVRFFTLELSERYEEINLLYSISETLGSILKLEDAAEIILGELCDLLGALRGSLWVFDRDQSLLRLTASVGETGHGGPLDLDDPEALTARVFREQRAVNERAPVVLGDGAVEDDSRLSVPIRYTPRAGECRTVGVINLIGRRLGGRFTASDQKLLSAIASQVGAALETNRLLLESVAQERVSREMELAHDLQMKLLPSAECFEGADVASRVEPAESVGGDFYHLLQLPNGRVGVMIGDVSGHGFPAALVMALSMSAATIYATGGSPSEALRRLDDALREELENTEVYLSLFYGVIDPERRRLIYSNAGHPHAFIIRKKGDAERLTATDPPVGIAGPDSYVMEEVAWSPGEDLLLLFTDGLSDYLTSEALGNGEKLILRIALESRDRRPAEIVESLFEATRGVAPTIPSDDRTALVLRL